MRQTDDLDEYVAQRSKDEPDLPELIKLAEERMAPAVLDIAVAPSPDLKRRAETVIEFDEALGKLIDSMFETMEKSNGMGLAANQVGINRRIIVMDVDKLGAYEETVDQDVLTHGRFEIVNPSIIFHGEGKARWHEGCLSVPGFQFEIERWAYVVVEGLDRRGNPVRFKAAGLLAACVQHEIDHLNGMLFIDRISRLKRDMVFAKLRKLRKRGHMIVPMNTAPRF